MPELEIMVLACRECKLAVNKNIIFLTLLLTSCSTISFKDSVVEKLPPSTKNKTSTSSNSNVTVDKDQNVVIDVQRVDINKSENPNKLFKEYSIYFDLDEYTVQERFLPMIKQHAEFLAKNPERFAFIEGHTDERGGVEYNLALGQRRANAVRLLLMHYGASDKQIEAYSYGSTKPKASGSNEEAWSQNRRVDIEYRND